jgi:hypothetical protein
LSHGCAPSIIRPVQAAGGAQGASDPVRSAQTAQRPHSIAERLLMTRKNSSTALDDTDHEHSATARKQRMRALFDRYPAITGDERRELTAYLKNGPLLEIGLLKGDETIRYKIAAFEQEQQKALANSPMSMVVLLVIFALLTLVLSVLWDMGG